MGLWFRADEEQNNQRGRRQSACEHEYGFGQGGDRRGVEDTEDERLDRACQHVEPAP